VRCVSQAAAAGVVTTRRSSAVAIRVHDTYRDGSEIDWYVGPFMPHVGSATDRAWFDIEHADRPTDVKKRELSVETLFLAPGESDLALEPR
jgi:hypothetical protein